MEILTKEDVRLNRDRFRKNIKNGFASNLKKNGQANVKTIQNLNNQKLLKVQPNSSEIIQLCDDSSYLNHIFPCSTFETMFELLEKVGQGSHSAIYKCRDLKTGKMLAAKVFLFLEPQNMGHVKQHYRIKKLLSHQNIVKANFLFFHIEKLRMAIVQEYCPYGTLRSFMMKNPLIPNSKIATIVFKITSAVAYMHKNGVCHRDIKPENIMYNPKTGELKLIDFELAKMKKYVNQKLDMWTNTGTLHYKAPQMFNGSYNQAIDVWAIGIIIYEMVYRKLPFDNEYLSETITAICETEPNYEGVEIHPSLLSIIKGCLTKNPQKRIKAFEVMKSPFILKFAQGVSSPKTKRKKKSNTDNEEQTQENDYKLKLKQVSKESYSEDDERSQHYTFFEDLGINQCGGSF